MSATSSILVVDEGLLEITRWFGRAQDILRWQAATNDLVQLAERLGVLTEALREQGEALMQCDRLWAALWSEYACQLALSYRICKIPRPRVQS